MTRKKQVVEEKYKWPARGWLTFYRHNHRVFLFRTSDRRFNMADKLMAPWFPNHRIVYMGAVTKSPRWREWDEENLKKIEWLIKYDLNYDGYLVYIERLTTDKILCSKEFLWKLKIRPSRQP